MVRGDLRCVTFRVHLPNVPARAIAIAIAILWYRLYDIDLIINRSVVDLGLTAILTALYTALVTLLQRVFISVSGQRSDAAAVVTAFVVVVAFSPIKDWLQRQVERRVPRTSPSAVIEQFRAEVDAVVLLMDVQRLALRLVDRAVLAFDAVGAALYLDSNPGSAPMYHHGDTPTVDAVVVELTHDAQHVGRLAMGRRRGSVTYSDRDREELQKAADLVAEALALSGHRARRPPGDSASVSETKGPNGAGR